MAKDSKSKEASGSISAFRASCLKCSSDLGTGKAHKDRDKSSSSGGRSY
jgi:hypothetical protein